MLNIFWEHMDLAVSKIGKPSLKGIDCVYGIPRGGSPIAVAIANEFNLSLVEEPEEPDKCLIVDDIADSGQTLSRFQGYKKFVLVMKKRCCQLDGLINQPIPAKDDDWVHFPWEKEEETVEDNITRIITYLNEDPGREGLVDTPKRVIKSYAELFGGYEQDPKEVLKRTFKSDGYDEMVIVRGIRYYSTCEHHMLPFYGKAYIGYIPGVDKQIVGLSKIPRVVDILSRRLQNQERLTEQIADIIFHELKPAGVGVVMEGVHFCMMSRGARKEEATMITSCLKGNFKDTAETRNEFMHLIRMDK